MDPAIEGRLGAIAEICARHGAQRLELFGAGACHDFDPAVSDLQFLVEFTPGPSRRRAECYFGLLHDIQRLFGRPVDLVDLGALGDGCFLQDVQPSRRVLYGAA